MARGRLEPPNLDDRTWQDLVDQAKALVPQYAPQWTDLGPSDPGMTLIELFAWLVEGMIYRLNRVPDKNYVAFLNLLGITRSPATPATTWLTYTSSEPVKLVPGTQAATQQTETQQAIVFETDAELTVLPSKLVKLYVDGMVSPNDPTTMLDLTADLVGKDPPGQGIVGKKLNLAGNKATFWLGFEARADRRYSVHVEIGEPRWTGTGKLEFSYSAKDGKWAAPSPAMDVKDETSGLRKTGTIAFEPPRDWTSVPLTGFSTIDPGAKEERYWLKVAFTANPEAGSTTLVELGHVLFNSVTATSVQTVREEFLGLGTGRPFQTLELANRPLYKDPLTSGAPYRHLELVVQEPDRRGGYQETRWVQVEELSEIGNQAVYRVEPVTGTLYFGGYSEGTPDDFGGKVPTAGSRIIARKYRYVAAAAAGNVPAGAINTKRTPNDKIQVINPVQAMGGTDEEDIEQTKRRAPDDLRNFNRAVTLEDYEQLARRASNRVRKVRCLGPRAGKDRTPWTYGGIDRREGTAAVIVIPAVADAEPKALVRRPSPATDLLHEVREDLDQRRTLTTALIVTGPRYLEVKVTAVVRLWPDAQQVVLDPNASELKLRLATDLDKRIALFLHPIKGNRDGQGWEIGQSLFVSGLFEFLQPVIGDLGYIESLSAAGTAIYVPPKRPGLPDLPKLDAGVGVSVADYEILCNAESHSLSVVLLEEKPSPAS